MSKNNKNNSNVKELSNNLREEIYEEIRKEVYEEIKAKEEIYTNLKEKTYIDVKVIKPNTVIRYDRNWTVETIYNQVDKRNIELNPKFQRRNVWSDEKKTQLIESIMLGYPIPEIVLAEKPSKQHSFIVLDGKQRLLTLIGFIQPNKYNYWEEPVLRNLKVLKDLEGLTIEDIRENPDLERRFFNTDIRCDIMTNIKDNNILYDIFYRLNAGSEPLNFQELRQALYPGGFSDFLLDLVNEEEKQVESFQEVMGLGKSDKRSGDVEILLRFFGVSFFGEKYKGQLKDFLDYTMEQLNKNWQLKKEDVKEVYQNLNLAIQRLETVFGGKKKIARLPITSANFNKALFEVQMYYFSMLNEEDLTDGNIDKFKQLFQEWYSDDKKSKSLTQGTNSKGSFKKRFDLFRKLINESFGLNIEKVPY